MSNSKPRIELEAWQEAVTREWIVGGRDQPLTRKQAEQVVLYYEYARRMLKLTGVNLTA